MHLIKLDAIDSTNDYLKSLMSLQFLDNFTVVIANNQTKGKGQMGSTWSSEPGKNLTRSILIKNVLLDIHQIYNLNVAVVLGIITALERYNIPKLSIKWPNDIMAETKKIGGILIENSIKNGGEIFSVVGIGINVNQLDFSELPKATSLNSILQRDFDIEEVLSKILPAIQLNVARLLNNESAFLWESYHHKLFKKGIPMPFETVSKKPFMGIIQGVTSDGKLKLLLENDTVSTFEIKEIQMLY